MNTIISLALECLQNGDITEEQYIQCLASEIAKNRTARGINRI